MANNISMYKVRGLNIPVKYETLVAEKKKDNKQKKSAAVVKKLQFILAWSGWGTAPRPWPARRSGHRTFRTPPDDAF